MKISRLTLRPSILWLIGTLLSLGSAFGEPGKANGEGPGVLPSGLRVAAAVGDAPQAAPLPATALITREWKIPVDLIPRVPPGSSLTEHLTDRESVRQWLTGKGIVTQPPAAAVYIVRSSRLIVRNTQDQIDLIDVLLEREIAAHPTTPEKKTGEPEKSAAVPEKKEASDPVIPKLEFRDATPAEVFQAITAATGIKIFYTPAPGAVETRITLSLTNVPASEAFRYVTSLAGLKATTGKDGVHIEPK